MEPKRLGDFAQAKYDVQSETASGARATRAEDPRENVSREVDVKDRIDIVEFLRDAEMKFPCFVLLL